MHLFLHAPWKNINTLIIGAILCRGARHITSILRVMGLGHIKNFSKYHRILSDVIMLIRISIWVKMYFSTSKNQEKNTDSLKITEKNANLLIYQLALAA